MNSDEELWPPTITPCECVEPGWCQRHQIRKPAPWHLLCRRQQAYFEAWERGQGPGQVLPLPQMNATAPEPLPATNPTSEVATDSPAEVKAPSLLQRAHNFGQAVVRHIADRGRQVTDQIYDLRLSACRNCPSCDLTQMVCRDPACGCFLQIKARWASENCPQNKWPKLEPSAESSQLTQESMD